MNREQRRKTEKLNRRILIAPKRLKHEKRSMSDIENFYHTQLEMEKKKANAARRKAKKERIAEGDKQ
jgi:hypothetical protein